MDEDGWIYPGTDGLLPGTMPDGLYEAAIHLREGAPDQSPTRLRVRRSKGFWANEEGGEVPRRYLFLRVRRVGD